MDKNLEEELRNSNKELILQNEEKEKRITELALANKEFISQNDEKEKRVSKLDFIRNKSIARPELRLKYGKNLNRNTKVFAFQQRKLKKRTALLADLSHKLYKTEKSLNKANRLFSFISHINKTISRVNDEQTLFDEVCRIAVEIGNFKMAWIGMTDISNHKIKLVASKGATEDDLKMVSDKTYHGHGLTDAILGGLEYCTITNIQENELINWKAYAAVRGFISAVSLPVKKSGNVIGTFTMYTSESNIFSEEEVNMLKEVAEDLSFGVDLFEKEKIHQKTVNLVSENEMRFRTLIENSMDMKTLTNKEGKMTYCSPTVKKVLGYSSEEYLQLAPQDIIHPDDLSDYFSKWNYIIQLPGQSIQLKQRRLHKNRKWVWCEGSITNMFGEKAIGAMVSNFRDITEKIISKKLHEFDKNNLDALINSTDDLMWSLDRNFKLITSNIPFENMIKRSLGRVINKGEDILSLANTPEKLSHLKRQYERAFAGENFVEVEQFDFLKETWFEISYYPIRKGDEVIGTACHSRNITSIKAAVQELRKSEAFSSGLLNSLRSHIAVIDSSGNIIGVNESWNRYATENGDSNLMSTGIGSNYFEVCSNSAEKGDAVAADVLRGLKEVIRGKKDFYLEYPCHSPDKQAWFALHARKFKNDGGMVVVSHHNISERKLAENNLMLTSKKLQFALNEVTNIMDSSLDVICAIDVKGNFLKVSAASEAVWGYKPEELIGTPLINLVYHEDSEKTQVRAAKLMEGDNFSHFENRYVRKDGSLVPIEWSAQWNKKDQVRYGIARDVTEKKRLQKAFEAERKQFFDLFSEAPSSMGVLSGPHHSYSMANPPYLELIGKKDIIGKSVLEVLPEIEEQGYIKILDKVYQTGEAYSANEKLIKLDLNNDGRLVDRYLNFLYQPHKGNNGNIDGIFFFAVDVSEQVFSRKKIEESEARLNEAQALSHISNWGIDLATGVHTWSNEFYAICGIAPGDIAPSSEAFLSFVHPDDAAFVKEAIQKTFQSFVASHFFYRIIERDGLTKYVYSEWKFDFDKNDQPLRLYGIMQDITESTKAAENLKNSEGRFREFFELAPESILVIDSATMTFVKFNENALRLLKYSTEELMNMGLVDISPSLQPDGRASEEKGQELILKALNGEKLIFEWMLIDEQGKEIISEVHLALISNKNGPQVIANFADISGRKENEKGMATITLDLLQRNKALEQFTYIVSHNLRAPVANIMALTDAISEIDLEDFDKKILMDGLSVSVLKLNDIIYDLNDILRVKNNLSEKKEYVYFSQLIDNIQISINDQIKKEHVLIETDFSAVDKLLTLKSYLYSIFYNLISNSIKFRQPGLSPVIVMKSFKFKDKIELHYSDNGLGINIEKEGDQLFGLYKRFHLDTEGKGIGLFMTKTQVETLGGKISVESEVNKGVKFLIQFPI
jgi:PAS domain S-box-containing protein